MSRARLLLPWLLLAACVGEDEVVLSGRLSQLVLDGRDGTSRVLHVLERADGEVELELPAASAIDSGSVLEVRGHFGDAAGAAGLGRPFVVRDFVVDVAAANAQALIVDPARAPPARKVAVFLLNFFNDDRQPLTVEEARRKIFTDPDSTRAFYKEQSYGLVDFAGKSGPVGDVFGWYTIDIPNRPCAQAAWGDAALAKAKAAGVDTEGYDHHVFLFPATPACAYLGLGQQPGKKTWINGATITTVTHELGHNLGTPHASSRLCKEGDQRVAFSASCTDSEYGNPFDVMGAGFYHTHAINKAQARWLSGSNLKEVSESGVYTLVPQEMPSDSVQLLSVPRGRGSYYHLDYRRPFGFDRFPPSSPAAGGVMVVMGASPRRLSNNWLLDMKPATTTLADAPLAVGDSFEDRAAGVKITLMAATATEAKISVELAMPPADAAAPGPVRDGSAEAPVVPADGGASDAATMGGFPVLPPGMRPEAMGATKPPAPPRGRDVGGCTVAAGTRASGVPGLWLLLGLIATLARRRPLLLALGLASAIGLACESKPPGAPPAPERTLKRDANVMVMPEAGAADAARDAGAAETRGDAPADGGVADAGGDARDGGEVAAPVSRVVLYPVPAAVEAACQMYATIRCAKIKECAPERFARDYASDELCVARNEAPCRTDFLVPARRELPRDRTACARATMAQSCRDFRLGRALPACTFPPGALARGARCFRTSECGPGLRCKLDASSCGSCEPALPVGADCAWWYDGCAQGTFCYDDRCLAPRRLGEACKMHSADCDVGTACTAQGCAAQTAIAGASCAAGDVCDPSAGLYCNLMTKTCAPLPTTAAAGQACGTYSPEGAPLVCAGDATCFAMGSGVTAPRTCVAKAELGQPCDASKGITCKAPGACAGGVCVMPVVVTGTMYTPPNCE